MKYLILVMIAFTIGGCASNPKVLMKNCTKIHDDYFECDPIPEKPVHEHGGRFRQDSSVSDFPQYLHLNWATSTAH